jgi:hypothetical protein
MLYSLIGKAFEQAAENTQTEITSVFFDSSGMRFILSILLGSDLFLLFRNIFLLGAQWLRSTRNAEAISWIRCFHSLNNTNLPNPNGHNGISDSYQTSIFFFLILI